MPNGARAEGRDSGSGRPFLLGFWGKKEERLGPAEFLDPQRYV